MTAQKDPEVEEKGCRKAHERKKFFFARLEDPFSPFHF